MTSSLRSRVVEAGARARYERMVARMVEAAAPKLMLLPEWDELDEDDRQAQLETAAVYLDAMLNCLTENADEWVAATNGVELDDAMERGDHKLADVLLAVLREDR